MKMVQKDIFYPEGLKVGDKVIASEQAEAKLGNA